LHFVSLAEVQSRFSHTVRAGDAAKPARLAAATLLTRGCSDYLTDRYSERKEEAAKLEERLSLQKAL
jgi:hypothetical protein